MTKSKSKHMWLCIDPGITTGWALLDDDGAIKGTAVAGTGEIVEVLDTLIRMANRTHYDLTAVIEKMPNTGRMGALGQKLEQVRRDIYRVVEDTFEIDIILVPPGAWKPSRIAKTTKVPAKFRDTPLMIHQKDAVRMGRYAMDMESRRTHSAKESK